ncbi:cytochrome-c peroxidase [Nitrosomonas aestuarii]|uniref:cytochrome-c peroxidase n=1 Tax=Nitrosomonas aestuarii TaxID=52441 RepID=UPI000D317DD5|nr:cytochrome-c peroxidase [Nitrosomonas aestuarii]PTN12148.1 cytochrome c peroxidase [Nitrosomonas aestuarii]
MKFILLLTLFLSAQAFAQDNKPQSSSEHENGEHGASHGHGSGKHSDDHKHEGGGHGDDHHGHEGGMHGGGHGHKIDKTTLKQFFEPLPDAIIDAQKNAALIKLGKKLYLDPRLSVNDQISCNSCHSLSNFGVDNEPTSPGHEGKRGDRNSPTTMNAALHIAQFWDGRASTVEEQALGPILNAVEMGMPGADVVVKKLTAIEEYKELFAKAFADEKNPLNYKNIGVAIGAFERTLLTPSRFDDYLKGDEDALSQKEKRGLKKFINMGCVTCHNGVAIGGNSYKKIGIVTPYETSDMGRYEVTKIESDKKAFKVPSLRNITKTAPYFHDGSVETLDEAIQLMAKHQLGRDHAGHGMVRDIKAFLGALTAKDAAKDTQ